MYEEEDCFKDSLIKALDYYYRTKEDSRIYNQYALKQKLLWKRFFGSKFTPEELKCLNSKGST